MNSLVAKTNRRIAGIGPRQNLSGGLRGSIRLVMLASGVSAFSGMLTVLFVYQLVFAYYVLTPDELQQPEAGARLATGWGPPTFFGIVVCAGAYFIAFRAGTCGARLGVFIGVSAAATVQLLVGVGFPPVIPQEVLLYAGIGIAGGAVGGLIGTHETERSAQGEKALLRATKEMTRAGAGDEVAKALATALWMESVAVVAVWSTAPWGANGGTQPSGSWFSHPESSFPTSDLISAARGKIGQTTSDMMVQDWSVPQGTRRTWEEFGIRSALVAPLLRLGGESSGLVFVGFRRRHLSLTSRTKRRVLSAAASAALALEKGKRDERIYTLRERERLSREIHDSLIQYLGSITGELDAAEMAAEAGVEEMVPHHISRAREATRRATGETRRVMQALRPGVLEGSSLPEALAVLTRRSFGAFGIEAALRVVGEVRALAPETEHDLARIAQEALANARKHSKASRVNVLLAFEPNHVTLEVADNGVGLDATKQEEKVLVDGGNSGFGLQSMRERTERVNGRIRVESSERAGTKVMVEVPA